MIFRVEQGERSLGVEFDRPIFELFGDLGVLHQLASDALMGHGCRVGDLRFQYVPNFADQSLTCTLTAFSAELVVRPERAEIRSWAPARWKAMEIPFADMLHELQKYDSRLSISGGGAITAMHAAPVDDGGTEKFFGAFGSTEMIGRRRVIGRGLQFQLEAPFGDSSTIYIEPSLLVERGIFFRYLSYSKDRKSASFSQPEWAEFNELLMAMEVELVFSTP